jgi:hypothetical protein
MTVRQPVHGITLLPAAAAVLALTLAGLGICVASLDAATTVLFVTYSAIGGYLATRPAAGRIGWLLVIAGWGLTVGSVRPPFDTTVLAQPGYGLREALYGWASSSGWSLAFTSVIGLALVYPSGRLPTGTGGRVARAVLGSAGLLTLAIWLGPTINVTVPGIPAGIDVDNPFGLLPPEAPWSALPNVSTLYATFFVAFVAAVGMLLGRYRRAQGLERLQYRWLVAAAVLVAFVNGIWAVATFVLQQGADVMTAATTLVSAAIPIAVAVAVQRYRLYAIDRIISRTLSWLLVTAVVVGVFAVAVLGLQWLLSPLTANNTIAVAGSTLLTAALFQPIRLRIQRLADNRFNRARIDADRVSAGLAARLRSDSAFETIATDLHAAVAESVAPTTVSTWIRQRTAGS